MNCIFTVIRTYYFWNLSISPMRRMKRGRRQPWTLPSRWLPRENKEEVYSVLGTDIRLFDHLSCLSIFIFYIVKGIAASQWVEAANFIFTDQLLILVRSKLMILLKWELNVLAGLKFRIMRYVSFTIYRNRVPFMKLGIKWDFLGVFPEFSK